MTDPSTVLGIRAKPSDVLVETWSDGLWGTGIGLSNLVVADLTGDGRPEVIAGASTSTFAANTYWYVGGYDAASGGYQQVWLGKPLAPTGDQANAIARIVLDAGGAAPRVLVADTTRTLSAYSGWPLERERGATIPDGCTDVQVGDLDGDGRNEVVLATEGSLHVLDAESLAELWSTSAYGARDLALGQLDGDPALEIVAASADGRVIDGVSRTVERTYPGGFGASVEVGNVDDDATLEIVGAEQWYRVAAFDATSESPLWEIPVDLDVGALRLLDLDGDGTHEVVIGEGQWGDILVYDARTQGLLRRVDHLEHGTTDVALGDVDGDGLQELLWGSGHTSTGPDLLGVADAATGALEWTSQDLGGPLAQLDVGDVDADGDLELVVASRSSESGYSSGVIAVYDATTHALEWRGDPVLDSQAWTGLHQLRVGNLDDDPQLEIVVGSDRLYDGAVAAYDGLSHEIQLEAGASRYEGAPVHALALADADGDGTTDLVAGLGRAHTGAEGKFVVVLDPGTGEERWRSADLGSYWSAIHDVAVAELDGEAGPEVVATVSGEGLWVLDGATGQLRWTDTAGGARVVDAFDLDGDGDRELLVGTEAGQLRAYDAATHEVEWTLPLGGRVEAVRGVTLADGTDLVVAAAGGYLRVVDPTSARVVATSEFLGNDLGLGNHLAFDPGASGTEGRLWVGAETTVYEFSLRPPPPPPPPVRLVGTTADEALSGRGGADTLLGGGGSDTLLGHGGSDLLGGDAGDDSVEGGTGDDLALGDGGDDQVLGGGGDDAVHGGPGHDTLDGGAGADTVDGEGGSDRVAGGGGADRVSGGGDADTVEGGAGNDTALGGAGDDLLRGEEGDDLVRGGAGADLLVGGAGRDTLAGEGGDDTLRGSRGGDSMLGGEGADSLLGGLGADTLVGGAGDDALQGGVGNDLLRGGAGADVLAGGTGADRFVFGAELADDEIELDVVSDYRRSAGDLIDVQGGVGVIAATVLPAGTLLAFDTGDLVLLQAVTSLTDLAFA